MKKIIKTSKAPAPIGPYNQAILSGNTLYTSGQIAINPRTGELLGADIMLEYVHFTNRVYYDRIFSTAANYGIQSDEDLKKEMLTNKKDHLLCSQGHLMHENNMFGQIVLAAAGASDLEMEGMKKEGMKSLIMHEVGHTLGLNHNMKASQLFSPEQLADAAFIKGKADAALAASAVSTFGGTLIDDADAATARTTLGLGTVATTASSAYATAAQGTKADSALQSDSTLNADNMTTGTLAGGTY